VPVLALANSVVRYYGGDDTVPSLGSEPMRPLDEEPPGTEAAEEQQAERAVRSGAGSEDPARSPDPDDPGNPTVPGDA
jgi:hypothetical protein